MILLSGNIVLAEDNFTDESKEDLIIEVEAANGKTRQVDLVDTTPSGYFLGLFTDRYGTETGDENKFNVAVQVNENQEIIKIANKDKRWTDSNKIARMDERSR